MGKKYWGKTTNHFILSVWLLLMVCTVYIPTSAQTARELQEDSLRRALRHTSGPVERIDLLLKLAQNLYAVDAPQALAYAAEAYSIAKNVDYAKGKYTALLLIIDIQRERGNDKDALEYALVCLKECEKAEEINNKVALPITYYKVGVKLADLQQYKKSVRALERSALLSEKAKDLAQLKVTYSTLSNVNAKRFAYKEAYEYYLKFQAIKDVETSEEYKRQINETLTRFDAANKVKEFEVLEKEKKLKAYEYELLEKKQALQEAEIELLNRDKSLRDSAIKILQKDQEILLKDKQIQANAIALLNKDKRIRESEIKLLTQDKELKSREIELLNKDNRIQQDQIEILERDRKIQEQEAEQRKMYIYGLMGGLAVIAGFSILVLLRYFEKRKTNRLLKQQNERITEQSNLLKEKNTAIESAYEEIRVINENLGEAFRIIDGKNKSITDSIQYAKRIQESILPPMEDIMAAFPNAFVFYKPKDIVSGDFYWFTRRPDRVLIAAVDCTGHGVPGAFMSVLGYSAINQIVNERGIIEPGEILTQLNQAIRVALQQNKIDSDSNDGMDLAICAINLTNNQLKYAGANRPLFWIHKNEMQEIKGEKQPIGGRFNSDNVVYTQHDLTFEKGDAIYLCSDGYIDQFGGAPQKKKFLTPRFKELLTQIYKQAPDEQRVILEKTLDDWQGKYHQLDDILVIGIRL